jgi:hypothetical protein
MCASNQPYFRLIFTFSPKALKAAGLLSSASAITAAQGYWPTEFASLLSELDEDAQFEAQVDWGDPSPIRYENDLLQNLSLAHANGDQAAATALLDQLFGIA